MYIGHLPHGFYEKQLMAFFSQFGTVKHVRVSRSQKVGVWRKKKKAARSGVVHLWALLITVLRLGLHALQTNRSRGYAFVEFEDEDVAEIARETMDNYLMFDKILKCAHGGMC